MNVVPVGNAIEGFRTRVAKNHDPRLVEKLCHVCGQREHRCLHVESLHMWLTPARAVAAARASWSSNEMSRLPRATAACELDMFLVLWVR
jgi:hypothetical protein